MRRYSVQWNAELVPLTTEQFPANHYIGQNARNVVPNSNLVCVHGMKELGLIIDLRQQSNQNYRFCGLVVRVLSYRSGGPGSIPGTTRKKK
jgi:hypothetical protein